MNVVLKIKRFDPKVDKESYFQEYPLTIEDPTMRLVDALNVISRTQDSTLSFRASCLHGVCGSDAVIINGKEGLACKTLFQDLVQEGEDLTTITLEPLNYLTIEKDLIVNQEPFFDKYKSVKPYFIPNNPVAPQTEYLQSQEEREIFDDATKCISCASCYSACPILKLMPNFMGPMAVVQAARFIDDSRDEGFAQRIDALDQPEGIWACENKFECTKVCPRGIKITKIINFTKRKIKAYRKDQGKEINDKKVS